ncbi:MAG: indolepyruvate ferredoxin oxidoreductase, alpha subunit [Clostridiales bacterium]|nr:indolepyruvate ferredoxin oxidoreductase, alpha subunit [Clostridiales bacterium]
MKDLLLGNEALARGAYEAGVRVATAYPGTPSTEITEAMALYPAEEVYVEWSPNEKVALEVAIGASVAGARAMASMKHVGLNVAADPLFTAAYTGVNGGLVIVTADDPGLFSSQNEQDNRLYAQAAHIPMLEPSDSQEAKDFAMMAFELSERFDLPILLRMTTRVSHARGLVEIGERKNIPLKEYKRDINKYVMMPAMAKRRHYSLVERMSRVEAYANECHLNRIEWGDRRIGIITDGIAYQYAKEAMPDASYLKLGMVYPLPAELIKEFAVGVDKLYVIEELEPFIETQVKALGIHAIGKEIFPVVDELNAEIIAKALLGRGFATPEREKLAGQHVPVRPPVMCPGCPHRGVFYVLDKLKLTVTGDIGCYTLGATAPLSAMDLCVCMGASIGSALGMEKARGKEWAHKTVAVIGDSTFIHSGITGLIDMVYNKGTGTVIILDNSTTGMTGHQDHPATGWTIRKEPTYQASLEALAKAAGVNRITVIDPYDMEHMEAVIKEETATDEPSVIIARRPCILLDKKRTYTPYTVDMDKCMGCEICMHLGCPAMENDDGAFVIDVTQCNGCGLCSNLCIFDAIKEADI